MTVFNRSQVVLINTINALGKTDMRDTEIVIVDDGSTFNYDPLIEAYAREGLPITWFTVDTVKDRPETYRMEPKEGGNYNNPAYAYNQVVERCRGDYIFGMSSDCIVQPQALSLARTFNLDNIVWMPCITDLDTGQEYLGPNRLAPFGWFFGTAKKNVTDVGWDEEYLKGIAFEDNDFMGRLGLHVGRMVVDGRCMGWHQSHQQQAYSDDMKGWKINEAYTREKWGGIPWYRDDDPLEIETAEVNAQTIIDVKKKERLIEVVPA
jgi:glycosyltransferase involved in cell wall biosynthesis